MHKDSKPRTAVRERSLTSFGHFSIKDTHFRTSYSRGIDFWCHHAKETESL